MAVSVKFQDKADLFQMFYDLEPVESVGVVIIFANHKNCDNCNIFVITIIST